MKFLNRRFLAGVLVGVVLTAGAVAAFVAVTYTWMNRHGAGLNLVGSAPEFPESEPIRPLRAAENWPLHDLSGAPVDLEKQRGQVIFLNKWATWCHPCVAELPSIEALYDSLHAEGVFFALVSDEDPATVRSFVQKRGLRAPVYVTRQKPPNAYQSQGIPATYIVDKGWNVVAEHFGSADWNVERSRRYLRRLLAR